MDAVAVKELVREIRPIVTGKTVVAVERPGDSTLLIDLSDGGTRRFLSISCLRLVKAFFLTDSPEAAPKRPKSQKDAFNREIRAATLTSVAEKEGRPVVEMRFRKTDSAGRVVERSLIADLGSRQRLILTDTAKGTTIASATPRLPRSMPSTPKTRERDEAAAPRSRAPAGSTPTGSPDAADTRPDPSIAEPAAKPAVTWWRDGAGLAHARLLSHDPPRGLGETRRFDTFNEASSFMFSRFWEESESAEKRARVIRTLTGKLRRTERAISKVEDEIRSAGRADEYRRHAHLILTRKGEIRKGQDRVRLVDFDGTGWVEFSIRPELTPAQNADALFKRARKADRRGERAPARLEQLGHDRTKLLRLLSAAETASRTELEDLEQRLVRPPREREGAARARERVSFRRYTVSGGWEVLVGKSNRDNDILTHKTAAPNDLWFHSRQSPGSHVILRRSGKKAEPDKKAILEAAAIAAYHSRAGKSSKVAVCYTEKRFVRKPRGAKPGTAVVTREKVVIIEPRLPAGDP